MPAPLSIGAPAVRASRLSRRQSIAATTPSLGAGMSAVKRPEIGAADRRPLRLDDLVHLLERRAAVEQFAGPRIAGAAAQLRIVFEQMRGEPQRFLAQVGGAAGSFASTAITSCASSTGPMPLPIGWRPSVVTTSTAMPK